MPPTGFSISFSGLAGGITRIARRLASGLHGRFTRGIDSRHRLTGRRLGFPGELAGSLFGGFTGLLGQSGSLALGIADGAVSLAFGLALNKGRVIRTGLGAILLQRGFPRLLGRALPLGQAGFSE